MIRVLQVLGALVLGGAESRVMDIYRNMDSKECQFDFVSMKPEPQYYENEIIELGGHIYKIGFPREVGIFKNITELRECIRQGNYNAVHAHTSYHCGIVMLAAWLEKVPVRIAHARTNGSRQRGIKTKLANSFGRLLIKLFSTKKLAISNAAGEYLFGKNDYEVLPNAIDTKKYQNFDNNKIAEYRKEFDIHIDSKVIGHIGRFDPMKNHDFVLNCFFAYLKKHPNTILILVGEGELKESIEKKAKKIGVDSKVRFLGQRDDVPELIHLFDVLLFPSVFEGLGGVTIEAQAAGVPVVESDNIPIETDMEIGMVKRVSLLADINEWINAIENSFSIQVDYNEINAALEEKGYDLDRVCDKYIHIYGGR